MRLKHCAVFLGFLSPLAIGQNSAHGLPSLQHHFQGIKVLSSTFDSSGSPQTVQLDVINDSAQNITAWGYCVDAQKASAGDPDQNFCTIIDPVPTVVDREIRERVTLKPTVGDCPDCHFVHPGERKRLSANFSMPVASAAIRLTLVAYSDGTAETSGQDGAADLQTLTIQRKGYLQREQRLTAIGKRILSDASNQHPAMSMIEELQNQSRTDRSMEGIVDMLKTPEWRHADNQKFIPDDERGYLATFVSEHETKAAELPKYQIKGVR